MFEKGEGKVGHYLHASSEQKLLEVNNYLLE
jgi:hypothetical protein